MSRQLLSSITGLFVVALLHLSGVFSQLQNNSQDLFFHLRGAVTPSQSIVIIGVDEKSQINVSAWPFPRDVHAALMGRLEKAKAVGFDFLFSAETDSDAQFSHALAQGPPVVLAVAHGVGNELLTPSHSISGYSGTGHVETLRSGDGIVRNVELAQGANLPSFALALYRAAGFTIKENMGVQRLINYLGPEKTFLTLSYSDVIAGLYNPEFFSDRIVLVGADDMALGDSHSTPFSQFSSSPGVEIQANILHNILSDNFLITDKLISWLALLACISLAVFMWPVRSESFNCIANCIVLVVLIALAVILFHYGVVIDYIRSLAFLGIAYLSHLLFQAIWMAKRLFEYINSMESRIKRSLKRIFHVTPGHLGLKKKQKAVSFFPEVNHHFLQIKSATQALDLQNEFIENILSVESPPLILWDRKTGTVNLTNKGFDQLWNNSVLESHSPPELSSFIDFVNERSTSKNILLDDDLVSSDNLNTNVDILLPDSKGRKQYYRISLRHFSLSEGLFKGILAGLTDVTEIKEMERIKDEVVSIVSHELKLPLTTIYGYGEMLEAGLSGKQKEFAGHICKQSKRLNTLIADFLDINRLESGRTTLNIFPFDLKYVTEESISAVTLAAKKKGISIETEIPAKVSPLVGDEQQLLQAIINILENSIKYSPNDTTVMVRVKEKQEVLIVEISDQGPGIPVSEQESIFNKFKRGKQDTRQDGFGLGLSFAKQVITLHEGHIGVKDQASAGTTIVFSLPKTGGRLQ